LKRIIKIFNNKAISKCLLFIFFFWIYLWYYWSIS